MALDFPGSPANGQQFVSGGKTWQWDAVKWGAVPGSAMPAPSDAFPGMDGTAAPGASVLYARGDHIHPTDTSRYAASNPSGYQTAAQVTASLGPYALIASPTFTGDPKAPTSSPGDNDTSIATTAFVTNAVSTATGGGPFLPLVGGTLTGGLTISMPWSGLTLNKPASGTATQIQAQMAGLNRWVMQLGNNTAEGVGNTGADFTLLNYDNTGVNLGAPLTIIRANGSAYFSGALIVQPPSGAAGISLAKSASGSGNYITGYTGPVAGPNARWQMRLGDTTAESGAATGSDFSLGTYDNSGNVLGTPLAITRATGNATFSGALTITPASGVAPQFTINATGIGTNIYLNRPAGAFANNVMGQVGGLNRWNLILGNATTEGGANVGTDFALNSYTDAGASLSTPLVITRSSGNALFSAQLTAIGRSTSNTGYGPRSGTAGPNQANALNIDWSGTPAAHLWIDATNQGQIAYTSDYRIKKDVADLPSMWERAKALRPISYTQAEYHPEISPRHRNEAGEATPMFLADDIERWGFVAHELQETLIPSAATGEKDSPTHVQSPNPWTVIATLTKALQEAMARIEALEAKLA